MENDYQFFATGHGYTFQATDFHCCQLNLATLAKQAKMTFKQKPGWNEMYSVLKSIDNMFDLLQHELADAGMDYVAYGAIARALGGVGEAGCEVKKKIDEMNKEGKTE